MPSRSRIAAGLRIFVRAAASSIASGRPSRRAQICSIRCSSPGCSCSRGFERAGAAQEQLRRGLGRQRRDGELVLGADPQRGAARDHELRARRDGQQPGQVGRGVEQLLEVVEHEQQLAAAEHGGQAFALGRAELLRDLRGHARGVVERGELDEVRAVGEVRRAPVRELEREVRLADPARPGQREQPHVRVGEQLGGGREIVLAAEQRRRRDRQGGGEHGLHGGRGRDGRVELERRVLGEDRGLQALELRARVQAEVLDQDVAGAAVGVERVGLAAGAVEGEHQLRVQALAEGVLGGEALELAGDGGVAAEREVVLEPLLERVQARAHQPVGLDQRRGRAAARRSAAGRGTARAPRAATRRRPRGTLPRDCSTSVSKRSTSSCPGSSAIR